MILNLVWFIKNLDLFITVSNSTAHFAGAQNTHYTHMSKKILHIIIGILMVAHQYGIKIQGFGN